MEFRNHTDSAGPSLLERGLPYFVMTYLSFVAIFAVGANTLTVVLLSSNKAQRFRHCLIVNLALADISSPLLTYWMVVSSSFYHSWQYGSIGCQFYAFVNCLVGMAAICSLALLSIEKNVTLGGTVDQKDFLRKHSLPLLSIVWIYATVASVPPFLGWGRFAQDTFVSSCSFDFYSEDLNAKLYVTYLLLIGFVVPVCLIISICAKIGNKIRHFRQSFDPTQRPNDMNTLDQNSSVHELDRFCEKEMDNQQSSKCHPDSNVGSPEEVQLSQPSSSSNDTSNLQSCEKTQIRATPIAQRLALAEILFSKQTFLVIGGFLICWTPYALLTVFCQIDLTACYNPLASAITLMMAKTSVAINPIIYVFSDKVFRARLIALVRQI